MSKVSASTSQGKFVGEQTIPGVVTWSAGTPPSGETKLYRWCQNIAIRQVTIFITLIYSVAGVTCSQVIVPLPTDMPNPVMPTGVSGANAIVCMGTGILTTTMATGNTLAMNTKLRRNAANTGWEFNSAITGTQSTAYVTMTISYFY